MKAQGTELYTIDPANGAVIDVGCVLNINGIDTTIEQNETTCLRDLTRTYVAGLGTPGAANFGLQFNPQEAVHRRLLELKKSGMTLKWAVGWSDGTGIPPTAAPNSDGEDDFVFPDTRSWLVFEGFMNSFPFAFEQNTQVTSNVGIQVSGDPEIIPKTGS